jgi:hypothetical protein
LLRPSTGNARNFLILLTAAAKGHGGVLGIAEIMLIGIIMSLMETYFILFILQKNFHGMEEKCLYSMIHPR